MNRRTITAIAVATASLTGLLVAQQPPDAGKPAFDVVSIKPHDPAVRGGGGSMRGGRLISTNTTALLLVMSAYNKHEYEIVNAPDWTREDKIDIQATYDPANQSQFPEMAQALLVERFGLKAHTEVKDADKYRLVLARSDGKLGPRMIRDDVDCKAPERTAPCGMRAAGAEMTMTSFAFPQFVTFLESSVGRRIDDETGLAGRYDFSLEWTRNPGDTERPSIYTALQEQLGLKLEPTRGPVNVLVIDHIDHPTPD